MTNKRYVRLNRQSEPFRGAVKAATGIDRYSFARQIANTVEAGIDKYIALGKGDISGHRCFCLCGWSAFIVNSDAI
jgi:hypothetical protein